MIAFTIHAYTTDSTEGVLVTNNLIMTEEDAAKEWWKQCKNKESWVDDLTKNVSVLPFHIFACKQDLTLDPSV